MNKFLPAIFLVGISHMCIGQHYTSSSIHYTSSSIFAHNDYEKPIPIQAAYQQQVGFIEADIFLRGSELLVAHTQLEINEKKTLSALYLEPLSKLILQNDGFAYLDHSKQLTLMIDLKTEGVATLKALVKELNTFPELLSCKGFFVAISGNVPEPSLWKDYPTFIHFDGRPNILYTNDQLERVLLISDSFRSYSHWNGKDILSAIDQEKITSVVKAVHTLGKPIRFWATPDFKNAWMKLMDLKVDVLNTDDVAGLSTFLRTEFEKQ